MLQFFVQHQGSADWKETLKCMHFEIWFNALLQSKVQGLDFLRPSSFMAFFSFLILKISRRQ